ncbi:MAG TPA: DUF2585 family protein, partial [Rhizomicrobium sp.]|nr:DUF2585 family protein [Rhizomicrobium sp.]
MKFIALHFKHSGRAEMPGPAFPANKRIATGAAAMSKTAPSGRLPAVPARLSVWAVAVGAALLVALQVAVLRGLGQPLVAASGHILLWVGDPFSPDTSQQLTDWYSFSHFIHGFIFFGLLRWIAPGLPFGARLLIAM